MQKLKNALYALSAFAVTGLSATGISAANPVDRPTIPNPTGKTDFGAILNTIITALLFFAGAVAVLFLIIGGFRYVVSAGNAEQVEGAKKTILYAILGLIIIFIAFVLVQLVLDNVLDADRKFQLNGGQGG